MKFSNISNKRLVDSITDVNLKIQTTPKIIATINDFVSANNGDIIIVSDKDRGGTFVYDSNKSDINDGGVVFNGWVRQFDGAVNIKWFSAKGDGTTDDTISITNALNYCSINKQLLLFPKGTYISDRIVIDNIPYINITSDSSTTIKGKDTDTILFYSREENLILELMKITNINFIDMLYVINLRYIASITKCLITGTKTNGVTFPYYLAVGDVNDCRINNNELLNCISDHQSGGIMVGTDIYDNGHVYIENNIIDNIKYTGDTEGTEVHAIIVMIKNVYILNNKITNIRTSQPQVTGCEPIYTKGFNVHIKGNYLIDSGALGGVITIKGAGIRDEASYIENNSIIFSDGYEDDTHGIQAYVNNTKIVNNYIKNSGGYGIAGASGEEALLGGLTIDSNEIINCRADVSIRFYTEGAIITNNKIVSPRYTATGYAFYFSALESNDDLTKVSATIENNTLYFDDNYEGTKYYFMRMNGIYSPVGNVNINNNKIIGPYTPGRITMYLYSILNGNTDTKLYINQQEYKDIISSQYLTDIEVHTDCKIWESYPTVGFYNIGETGLYKNSLDKGSKGWICTSSGTAGVDAEFNQWGALDDQYISKIDNYLSSIRDFILADTEPRKQKEKLDITVINDYEYIVTINGTELKYTSDADATEDEIKVGIIDVINAGSEPVTASDNTVVEIEADTDGEAFTISTNDNLIETQLVPNGKAFDITLPTHPSTNDKITILDTKGTFSINPITIKRNGNTILNDEEDIKLDVKNKKYEFLYTGTTWTISY